MARTSAREFYRSVILPECKWIFLLTVWLVLRTAMGTFLSEWNSVAVKAVFAVLHIAFICYMVRCGGCANSLYFTIGRVYKGGALVLTQREIIWSSAAAVVQFCASYLSIWALGVVFPDTPLRMDYLPEILFAKEFFYTAPHVFLSLSGDNYEEYGLRPEVMSNIFTAVSDTNGASVNPSYTSAVILFQYGLTSYALYLIGVVHVSCFAAGAVAILVDQLRLKWTAKSTPKAD